MAVSLVSSPVVVRPSVARRQQTRRTVCAAAPQKEARRNPVQVAIAGFAAAAIIAAQVPMAEAKDVKEVVCASNPTSKICLKNSGLKK